MSVSEALIVERKQSDGMQIGILSALSASHFVNDMMQSLLLSIYPLLKGEFKLNFGQLGLITLTYQLTASILQPLIGLYTDRRPKPFAASIGMASTMMGLMLLAFAHRYETVLAAAALIGTGSSVFHPESSRLARFASGGSHGFAQSLFQIGGNVGSAVGPLIAAFVILPYGRRSIGMVALITLIAMFLMFRVALWYRHRQPTNMALRSGAEAPNSLPSRVVIGAIGVLLILVFSKYFYLASLSSYYTFYLMKKFHVAPQAAQMYLFVFLFASAAGTFMGGPIGDRIGRKIVIWISILGVAPFALVLPFADLRWTCALTVVIGFMISSAFSAIVVFAQELAPKRVGLISGLFFGLAFGFGGLGAAVLGALADQYGIATVYRLCAYLPLLGIVTALLPNVRRRGPAANSATPRSASSASQSC
jgi:FSR family fosmidomycin resistance protein-like MFS transporter